MKANELRIWNYVKVNGIYIGEAKRFHRFNDDLSVIFFSEANELGMGEYMTNIEPIPLTEEWLLKLRSRESMPVKYKDIYIMLDRFLLTYQASYGFWYVYDFSGEEMLYITKVEFVHEWQNVYFALNGEELTINDNGKEENSETGSLST